MKEGTRYTLLGLFMVLALAALGTLMVMIGETPTWLGGAEWELRIVGVRQLSPIAEGTEVNLNGVNIGRVARLDFTKRNRPGLGVFIITKIKNKYSVPEGSLAKIYSPMLGVGRGHIDIIPPTRGSPRPLPLEAAKIKGEMASTIREIIPEGMIESLHRTVDQIGRFAQALTPVADDLHRLMEQREVQDVDAQQVTANLATLIERFDASLKNFNSLVGDDQTQEDVKAFAANLNEASRRFVELSKRLDSESIRLADNINTKLDRMDERLETFFGVLLPLLDNLDEAGKVLSRAAREFDEGKGSIALMLHDDRLYESLVESSERIGLLIATLQPLAEKIAVRESIPVKIKTPIGPIKRDIPLTSKAKK